MSQRLRRKYQGQRHQRSSAYAQGFTIIGVVLGLFLAHGVQIFLYAMTYMAIGAIDGWEPALYFSASTFTTVGFGDLVLDKNWRLFSAIESANGFLLIGWSTAFLVTVTARIIRFAKELED
ncbi:MAG: potassium channel family protein [Pseudomonadota bacterium]